MSMLRLISLYIVKRYYYKAVLCHYMNAMWTWIQTVWHNFL